MDFRFDSVDIYAGIVCFLFHQIKLIAAVIRKNRLLVYVEYE